MRAVSPVWDVAFSSALALHLALAAFFARLLCMAFVFLKLIRL
jgi:hypothetical protein